MPSNHKNAMLPRKLKILMLHGYTQSGPLFEAKTQRLHKLLEKSLSSAPLATQPPIAGVELIYPTGPFSVTSADMGGVDVRDKAHGWWKLHEGKDGAWEGLDEGLSRIAETLRDHGPVDGVMGFSQGAAVSAITASLLEPGRAEAFSSIKDGIAFPQQFTELQHPPLRFAVCFSGLLAEHPSYAGFYEPKIKTPVLHAIGSMDTVVEESASMAVAERCEGEDLIVRHPGAHVVPTNERELAAVIQFIRKICGGENQTKKQGADEEEDVLEMDLPF